MLGFYRYILGIELTVGYQLRQVLDDVRLRGNGISRYDIRIGELDGVGQRNRDLNAYSRRRHYSSSSTIVITLGQHSLAQTPHPLQ